MSTRSGKRIHSSLHENTTDFEAPKSEVKTRSRFLKDNDEGAAEKKRKNYVRYPSEEDNNDKVNNNKENRTIRKSRRNTLKERNDFLNDSEILSDLKKPVRQTRRTKLIEESQNNVPDTEEQNNKKKSTKKKILKTSVTDNRSETNEKPKGKSNKKRNKSKRKLDSNCVKNVFETTENTINRGISIDTYHSAAGGSFNDLVSICVENDTNLIPNVPNSANDMVASDGNVTNGLKSSHGVNSLKKRKQTNTSFHNDCHNEAVTEQVGNNNIHNNTFNKKIMLVNNIFDTITQFGNGTFTETDLQNTPIAKKNKTSKEFINITNTQSSNQNMTELAHSLQKNNSKKKKKSEGHDHVEAEVSSINNSFDNSLNKRKSTSEVINMESIELSNLSASTDISHKSNSTEVNVSTTELNSSNIKYINKVEMNNANLTVVNTTNTVVEDVPMNTTYEKSSQSHIENNSLQKNNDNKKYSLRNSTLDKNNRLSENSSTLNGFNNAEVNQSTSKMLFTTKQSLNATCGKKEAATEINTTFDKTAKLDTTFDIQVKDTTYDKLPADNGSIISSDRSNNLTFDKSSSDYLSFTSDDSKGEKTVNTTPILIESSMDESKIQSTLVSPKTPLTLKREGTFTKDSPDITLSPKLTLSVEKTPTRRKSLASPGRTPFLSKSTPKGKTVFNLTHSIEKSRRSSLADFAPKTTKVMFCSPINDPAVVAHIKRKVIKSNLKGSNKSFIFEDSVPAPADVALPSRKRSFTQSDADDVSAKRKRLGDARRSAGGPSRPRTTSAAAKLQDSGTPSKKATPKKEAKVLRTKLPNFAALHQKNFSRMESLNECQERKARRARQLLTPTAALGMLERISPKENNQQPELVKKPEAAALAQRLQQRQQPQQRQHPQQSQQPQPEPEPGAGYTRFGFRLALDGRPFNFSARNTDAEKKSRPQAAKRQAGLPSLGGGTQSRRAAAEQAAARERPGADRARLRAASRTVIRGVRTNRRFELQMRMRNIV